MRLRLFILTVLCLAALSAFVKPSFAQTAESKIGSDFIPSDAAATVVLSVADTLASPMVEMYPIEVAEAWCVENVGFPASSIDRIKVVVGAPGPGPPMLAVIATLKADLDVKSLNPKYFDTDNPIDVDGHRVYQIAGAPDVVLHVKDSRTLVMVTPNYLDTLLRSANSSEPSGALATMAATTPHTGNLTALVAMEPIRPMVTGFLQMQAEQIPPPLAEFTRIPELLDAILIRVNLEDQANGLNMIMLGRDDASTEELLALITRGLEMGRQMGLSQAMAQLQGDDAVTEASRQYAQRLAGKVVAAFTPTRDGRKLSLSGSTSQGFATNGVLISLLLPAVQSAREAARRATSSNNLKQTALAMHNYHDAYKHLPANIQSPDGTPLLSWRVAILPFLEQTPLYEQFHLDEPWDSPHNIQLIQRMPTTYSHPSMRTPAGTTVYQRPVSEEYAMRPSEPVTFREITDGTSNTIMALETVADQAVPWSKPVDVTIEKGDPTSAVVGAGRRGFNVLFCDGSVIFFSNQIDPQNFLGLLTRAGREAVER